MYRRYAVYMVPDGPWGDFGAAWLGWDCRSSTHVPILDDAQNELTRRPRKYGFHATIKPPFHLADHARFEQLNAQTHDLCAALKPITLTSLRLTQIGRFFALTAPEEHAQISAIAAEMVTKLDPFRAPLTQAELERRDSPRLSDRKRTLLQTWGYPHVLDQFNFHLTLTGPTNNPDDTRTLLEQELASVLDFPMEFNALCLLGEDERGTFNLLERIPLSG